MAKKSVASSDSVQRSILLVVSGLCHATLDSGGWGRLDIDVKNRSVAWEWEPPDTLLYQSQALDAARLALKRALRAGVSAQPGSR